MPPSTTIWKRRATLMAIVGVVVALPVTLLVANDDDGPGTATGPETPALNPTVVARELGAQYRVPEGWRALAKPGLILLDAPDRTTRLAISAPDRAGASKRVLSEALATTRTGYEDVSIDRGYGKDVGGLPAKGAVAHVLNRSGTRLDILIAVMEGEKFTYLVQVFTAEGAPPQRLAEAQAALNQLHLTR
jgi:hypothetical protein